ncbi:hypothetical protein ACS0TY_030227 [Phlomoides rotata]
MKKGRNLRISPLHTKFHSPLSHSSELVSRAFRQFLATFTFNPIHRLRALYAQSFRRTLAPPPPPRLTAAAGTELAGASSSSLVMIAHSMKELYKRHCPSSLTLYCWIGLSPIVQDSPLLPPLGAAFPSAQLLENNVRLACVKHIASVPSEPGSNSSFDYDWALQW